MELEVEIDTEDIIFRLWDEDSGYQSISVLPLADLKEALDELDD